MQDYLLPLLFLLLPIAVWSGYKIGIKRNHAKSKKSLKSEYFSGLNFLINEQPDKAIDAFTELLKVDNETVETHFALGNLFRKRGEVERALRIHQNLIARPTLPAKTKQIATKEIALDYMSAGVLDRAVELFDQLKTDQNYRLESLNYLLTIYQQTHEWEKAIDCCVQLEKIERKSHSTKIGHFYCEIAERVLVNQTNDKLTKKSALDAIKKALKVDSSLVRASILEGNIYLKDKQYKKALSAFKRVRHQDILLLPEVLENIVYCSTQLKLEKQLLQYLKECREMGAGISVILTLSSILESHSDDKTAADTISDYLRIHPSLRGLERLIQFHHSNSSGKAQANLELLHDLVVKLLEKKPIYQCNDCGFSGKTMFWQCPSCNQWSTIKPITGIEGE